MSGTFIQSMRNDRYVVFLAYADYRYAIGGLERCIRDTLELLRGRGVSALGLIPFPTRRSQRMNRYLSNYWGVVVDGGLCGFYDRAGVRGMMAALARAGKIPLETHIHNLRHFDLERVRCFLHEVPIPVKLFLHDYATICPKYSLLRNDERFCGRAPPSPEKCGGCASGTPGHHGRIRAVLESVRGRLRVVAPSPIARHIWLGTFPDFEDRVEVVPHLVPAGSRANDYRAKPPEARVRVAYVGAPYRHKGWEIFRQLSAAAAVARWPYEFYHFGLFRGSIPEIRNISVSILRDGPEAMTQALRRAEIDIVFLWALCPETYSYVLHECLLTNAMLVTNPDSGNIADTVAAQGVGRVFADWAELEAYLHDVQQVRRDVDFYRGKPVDLPCRFVPNDAILATLDWSVNPVLPAGPDAGRPNWLAGFLYGLKELKRRAGRS